MNKEQFMELLDYYFRNVDETTYSEIKNDYEEHFKIGLENGKTEEEISKELGNPREIFNECKEAGIIRENNFFSMFNLDSIGDFFSSKIFEQSKEKDYDLTQQTLEFDNDFHRIEVKSNADIDISTHDLDKVFVTYNTTDESQKLDVDYMNHVLKLGKVKMEKIFQKSFIKSISIKIPKDSDLGLNIATASGDVHVDVISNDVTCNSSSGDVFISTESDNVNVNTASGNVKVFKCRKNIFVNTVSGDVDVQSDCPDLNVHTVSGDVDVKLDENKNMNLKGVSSDFKIDVKEKKGCAEFKTVSGEIQFENFYKEVSKTISKSHTQSFTEDDFKITAATVSGDISLN
ncbi:DUF4097 family beta strand repeat-containing protein [uncultured Finegoldia sp.]|uniref:DUF4097 family beta strand repeat-containing protein n=1 Tax=uncultured Finegoldia sp. TaxID=328009 RepID=UPI0026124BD7|nr:DUF4097 family beta strand repeat-containing protein [uncultured Finegoldia sp.]